MYQALLYKRIKKFLEPVWRFRPSTRLLVISSSLVLVLMIVLGSTFLDDILTGINVRNQLYQESEVGDTKAPEFPDSLTWFGNEKHKLGENNAKVSIIHFWSAACVTCLDAYGRVSQWHDMYAQYGVNVYGIYAPQFDLEYDNPELINEMIDQHGMDRYPVALDESYAFNDAYYEATESFSSNGSVIVMIDQDGYIRHIIPDATNLINGELVIQGLLREAGLKNSFTIPTGKQRAGSSISTNLFFNKDDTETKNAFVAEETLKEGKQTYTPVDGLALGQWSLSGTWSRNDDHLEAISNGTVITNFTGKRAYIVVASDKKDYVGVSVNGEQGVYRAPGIAKDGILEINKPGIHQIIAADKTLKKTELQITVPDSMKLYQLIVLPD
jgi:hypothetical protein